MRQCFRAADCASARRTIHCFCGKACGQTAAARREGACFRAPRWIARDLSNEQWQAIEMSFPIDAMHVAPRALSVAALLLAASDALQARLAAVAVCGEISGFSRASSGHWYFTLKDADRAAAVVRFAMFRRSAALLDLSAR